MNFKQIQEIFLLVFVVIDIFLFTMIKSNKIQTNDKPTGSVDNTIVREMKSDSITSGNLSKKQTDGYYLSARPNDGLQNQVDQLKNQDAIIDDNAVVSTFKDPIKVDKANPEKTVNSLLKDKDFVINGKYYQFDKTNSSKNKLVYDQKVVNDFVNDVNGRITFNISKDHHLNGYMQRELTEIKVLHEKAPLISEQKAVVRLYQYNEIPDNSKILGAKLAYSRLLHTSGKDVYIPTWIIALQNKKTKKITIKRINAFNGATFKTEKVQVENNSTQRGSVTN